MGRLPQPDGGFPELAVFALEVCSLLLGGGISHRLGLWVPALGYGGRCAQWEGPVA